MNFYQKVRGRLAIPRVIGFGAGLTAVWLFVASLAGLAWGAARPRLHGTAVAGGGYSVDNLPDVEFSAFAWFVVVTSLLGLLFGMGAFQRGKNYRGLGMLLWVGVVAAVAAGAFYVFGEAFVSDIPEASGEEISWVPAFNPAVGLMGAPLVAMLAYWSATFVSSDAEWVTVGQ